MQTEAKSLGDVIREEGRGAHTDQHAASGKNQKKKSKNTFRASKSM